jgi:GNAT superfamily N-acetyltransferase
MHVVVFKDRCNRVIQIELDVDCTRAVAYHQGEPVGELSIDIDASEADGCPLLTTLFVEPAYRRSGIAHTLLNCASQQIGHPIRVDRSALHSSPPFESLCRCLAPEGTVILD